MNDVKVMLAIAGAVLCAGILFSARHTGNYVSLGPTFPPPIDEARPADPYAGPPYNIPDVKQPAK